MYAAYDSLSDVWQRFLEGLEARHESVHVHGKDREKSIQQDGKFVTATHPVIRVHPETGRKSLYVNSGFTTKIEGMKNKGKQMLCWNFYFAILNHPIFNAGSAGKKTALLCGTIAVYSIMLFPIIDSQKGWVTE